jgi:3-phenylpropionate/cinnamic acid dioxygenase small subunit
LQVLEDKEAIRQMLERYIEFNEARDYRAYSQLFASNGELKLRRGSAVGPENIFQLLQTSFGGPLPANSMLRNASHVLSNIVIEVNGDTATARSRWALLSPSKEDGSPRVAQSGFYTDKLVREKGEWKFLQRIVIPGIPVPEAQQSAQ